jgi:hypothetical protein
LFVFCVFKRKFNGEETDNVRGGQPEQPTYSARSTFEFSDRFSFASEVSDEGSKVGRTRYFNLPFLFSLLFIIFLNDLTVKRLFRTLSDYANEITFMSTESSMKEN